MNRKFLGIAALIAGCICSSAVAQTAVGNAGFEVDALYDVPPAVGNWTGFFGGPATATLAAIRDTTAPRTGASALKLSIVGDGNAFCGMQQPVNGVQPGVSYSMKIWARSVGTVNNGVEFRFEWKDANGGFIGNQFGLNTPIQAQLTETYQQFTLTAIAPAGAAGVNLVLAAQSFTFNPVSPVFDTTVFIDDVQFAADSLPGQAACCLSDGSCVVATIGNCPSGSQQAAGTTCSPNNCPAPSIGACCNNATAGCVVIDQSICVTLGANYRGNGTTCTPGQCTATAACPADFDGQNGLTVQDIFSFLNAWFAGCP